MTARILIVDDHEHLRKGIRELLGHQEGLSVCGEAGDGFEAIQRVAELSPDLVLIDVAMPRMDGLQAARIIRRESPSTKIIVVSQNDPAIVRIQAQQVGAEGFISKSDLSLRLIPAIEKLLGPIASDGQGTQAFEALQPDMDWLPDGSMMGRLMRSTDWSNTPLGSPDSWSPALRMMLRFMLPNPFPQLLWWGPELCCLYNDAYAPVLGAKHPWALGRPTTEVWSEVWHVIGPLVETPFHGGPATWIEDIPLEVHRNAFTEETHFTIAYSSVLDDGAPTGIGGVLATVHEITTKVVADRRLTLLKDLGARSAEPRSAEEACLIAAQTLERSLKDIPFALLYLVDEKQPHAYLAATSGTAAGGSDVPRRVSLTGPEEPRTWRFGEAAKTGNVTIVPDLDRTLAKAPAGPWSEPPSSAAIVPIRAAVPNQLAGFAVFGISSRLQFDESYRNFLELVSTQISVSITNARAYEAERKRSEALAEIDRAKTAFFSNVSHEFRTPLTLMLGPLQDLLSRSPEELSAASREQLELINRNGARLLRLVNTLLDFSRIEAGRTDAVYQATDLSRLTAELASVFRSATDRAGLQLRVECPELGEDVYVDRDMWEKIVLNLLSNAFKFTFDGEIGVALRRVENSVELLVSDTGVGIPAEAMPQLFERFHRVPNMVSRTYEGSGIGLALVHELVKLHGGTIRAESTVGKGTTFVLSIPLGRQHLPAKQFAAQPRLSATTLGARPFVEEALRWLPSSPESRSFEPPLYDPEGPLPALSVPPGISHRPNVLVADDNSDMRQYLIRLLSETCEIEAAADGRQALEAARRHVPDLVLSDVMMPVLDGLGLLHELRADPNLSHIPVILLSARAGEESRLEGIQAGADDYLIKPFSARELVARVEANIKMHRMREQVKAEQERAANEYETLLNLAPLGVCMVDSEFRIRHVNPEAEPAFGDIPDLIGRGFEEVVRIIWPKEYAEEIVKIFRHTLETGESYAVKERGEQRLDRGVKEYYDWSVDRVTLPGGEHAVVCYFRDVSVQVNARKMITESEQRFRAIVETTTECVMLIKEDGTLLLMNAAGLSMIGASSQSVVGKKIYDLVAQESREASRAFNEKVCSGARGVFEFDVIALDGSRRHMETHAAPLPQVDGSVVQLAVTRDITNLKRAEEKYRNLARSLEREVRARTRELEERNTDILKQSELLGELSRRLLHAQDEERRHIARELHDSAGQTLCVLAMSLAHLGKEAATAAPGLASNVQSAQELVDLLSREIRTMSYLLHPPLLDESGLSSAIGWYVQGLTERSGLEIALEMAQDFGRLPRDMELVVFRVVQECLTNIHRHSFSKTARIAIVRDQDFVKIDIRDSGKGISPEKLAELQAGSAGVGIRGMRERLRQFQGKLDIASDSLGTRVFVTLPFLASADEPTAKSVQATV